MHINYIERTLGNLWQIIVHHYELNSEHSNIFYVVSTLYLNRSVKPPPLWMTHYGHHHGVHWLSPRENSRHFVCCPEHPDSLVFVFLVFFAWKEKNIRKLNKFKQSNTYTDGWVALWLTTRIDVPSFLKRYRVKIQSASLSLSLSLSLWKMVLLIYKIFL